MVSDPWHCYEGFSKAILRPSRYNNYVRRYVALPVSKQSAVVKASLPRAEKSEQPTQDEQLLGSSTTNW